MGVSVDRYGASLRPSKTMSVEICIKRDPKWVLSCASCFGRSILILRASSGCASTVLGFERAAQLTITSGQRWRMSSVKASRLEASSCGLLAIPVKVQA